MITCDKPLFAVVDLVAPIRGQQNARISLASIVQIFLSTSLPMQPAFFGKFAKGTDQVLAR
jgi:hypothetical protein